MGVNLRGVISAKEISVKDLSGKVIAIDAFNWIYQFLTTIRLADGSPLTDRNGEVTSHINGLFYRSIMLLSNDVIPWFIFDGEAPKFKKMTLLERAKAKKEALQMAERAKTEAEKSSFLRRSVRIDDYIIQSSEELLHLLGITTLQAPAEGEAEAAYLNAKGVANYVASQDYDSLLFGASKVVRNLNVSERKKVANKGITTQVKPELIDVNELFRDNGLDRSKLILMGLLIGTDYNSGVKGIGPKRALDIVRASSKEEILSKYDFGTEYDIKEIYEYFMHPDVVDSVKPRMGRIDKEKLIEFMSERHSFDKDRVIKSIDRLVKSEDNNLLNF
ncbi:MAG: flap endonuclease-1 [Candidatus Acidifodinimicrobium sp.]